MWQDKLKEIIYILENSNVNEIEVNFWGRKFRVTKGATVSAAPIASPPVVQTPLPPDVSDISTEIEAKTDVIEGE